MPCLAELDMRPDRLFKPAGRTAAGLRKVGLASMAGAAGFTLSKEHSADWSSVLCRWTSRSTTPPWTWRYAGASCAGPPRSRLAEADSDWASRSWSTVRAARPLRGRTPGGAPTGWEACAGGASSPPCATSGRHGVPRARRRGRRARPAVAGLPRSSAPPPTRCRAVPADVHQFPRPGSPHARPRAGSRPCRRRDSPRSPCPRPSLHRAPPVLSGVGDQPEPPSA
ncbi:hypothetical protein QJS66_04730 [Kocuria rhizophila]|nr:hypothetical protein QJS66_04730 [Kocuria rhizophila]